MESNSNIIALINEIDWLNQVINQAIISYLKQDGHENRWQDIPLPDLKDVDASYAKIVTKWNLNIYERLALALTLAPHLKPEILDIFFGQNQIYNRRFTEFGGIIDTQHSGFIPTGQTLLFIISATEPQLRLEVMKIFDNENQLIREEVISLGKTESHIPYYNGIISMSKPWFHFLITGEHPVRKSTCIFPATRITTKVEWSDVVLDKAVMDQIREIETWIKNEKTLIEDWELIRHIKPGYRSLFYGPPGTGKTLSATLLGKSTGRDVYNIDLSMIVSKYIGETEKNISKIFDAAHKNNWILFFDEADALFGKRTNVKDAHDRYANQEIAYLLQRIEDYPGIVIISSNLKANFDDAFKRRFQSIIHFPVPSAEQRYQIWVNAFTEKIHLESSIDLKQIAENYEITGGAITNVIRFCALKAVEREEAVVTKEDLMNGIRTEFIKENKTI